jgi:dipeptidase E
MAIGFAKKVVAIGGGSLEVCAPIHAEIVRLSGRARPRVLFLSAASGDNEAYEQEFEAAFRPLNCEVDVLRLVRGSADPSEVGGQMAKADVIYVGGGDLFALLSILRAQRVDRMLAEAASRGAVLAGTSAGANLWFRFGLTDSEKFRSPLQWTLQRVQGLGFIDALGCPHFHTQRREERLKDLVAEYGEMAIALDDGAALVVQEEQFRIVVASRAAQAYRIYKEGMEVVVERLVPLREAQDLAVLLTRGSNSPFERLPRDAVSPRLPSMDMPGE